MQIILRYMTRRHEQQRHRGAGRSAYPLQRVTSWLVALKVLFTSLVARMRLQLDQTKKQATM